MLVKLLHKFGVRTTGLNKGDLTWSLKSRREKAVSVSMVLQPQWGWHAQWTQRVILCRCFFLIPPSDSLWCRHGGCLPCCFWEEVNLRRPKWKAGCILSDYKGWGSWLLATHSLNSFCCFQIHCYQKVLREPCLLKAPQIPGSIPEGLAI